MRHGVVRVDDVELELARDLDHSRRQRQDVLRFAEQRIRGRRHAVESQACLIGPESERRVGTEDVHVVPARGQRLCELGRDNPAPADRRVADDADVHSIPCGSRRASSP